MTYVDHGKMNNWRKLVKCSTPWYCYIDLNNNRLLKRLNLIKCLGQGQKSFNIGVI